MNLLDSTVSGIVKMPREFFVKAKNDYAHWRWALVREFVQNCYDAGATEIRFTLILNDDGTSTLTVSDDGCGMSHGVLTDVLLCLGGSMKVEGSVGGFGVAKTLLLFAHRQYSIWTGNNYVEGSGGDYTIGTRAQRYNGTCIQILMEDASPSQLEREIISFMEKCRLPRRIKVFLNDKELVSHFEQFEFKVKTELGDMMFDDVNGNESKMVVCIGGLPMFVHRVHTSGVDSFSGVLELHGKGADLLTANRDGLKGEYSYMLTLLIQRMIDNRFAFKGGQTLMITLNHTPPHSERQDLPSIPADVLTYTTDEDGIRYMVNTIFPCNFNLKIMHAVGRRSQEHFDEVQTVADVMKTLRRKWVQRLAVSWKIVVNSMLEAMLSHELGELTQVGREYYMGGERIVTGFVFSDELEGQNAVEGNERLILLNPDRFTKEFLIGDLMDVAAHELAHLFASGHSERFVEYDIRIRRTSRRLRNEATTIEHVAKKVRAWRSEDDYIV